MGRLSMVPFVLTVFVTGLRAVQKLDNCQCKDDNCLTFVCKPGYLSKVIEVKVQLHICEDDVTATISLVTYGMRYKALFSKHDERALTDLGASKRLGLTFFRTRMTREDKILKIEMHLVNLIQSIKVVKGELRPMRRGIECGFSAWFADRPNDTKAIVIACCVIFLLALTAIVTFGIAYRRYRNKNCHAKESAFDNNPAATDAPTKLLDVKISLTPCSKLHT